MELGRYWTSPTWPTGIPYGQPTAGGAFILITVEGFQELVKWKGKGERTKKGDQKCFLHTLCQYKLTDLMYYIYFAKGKVNFSIIQQRKIADCFTLKTQTTRNSCFFETNHQKNPLNTIK